MTPGAIGPRLCRDAKAKSSKARPRASCNGAPRSAGRHPIVEAHIGDRGLPAPEHETRRQLADRSSAWRRVSAPFSSEDGAIAGLDDATAEARRPPGGDPPPSATPGRRMYQKGLQTFVWKAEDADGDRLVYSVQYRREARRPGTT
jgi:hypothetical protein